MEVGVEAFPSTFDPSVREVVHQGGMDVEGTHVVRMREVGCGLAPRVFPAGEPVFHGREEVRVVRAHHILAFAAPAVYVLEILVGQQAHCPESHLPAAPPSC